jgi:hypothetical protein
MSIKKIKKMLDILSNEKIRKCIDGLDDEEQKKLYEYLKLIFENNKKYEHNKRKN